MEATTTYIILKELAGNAPPELNALQQLLAPHIDFLSEVWISVWIMTGIVLVAKLWHEYKKQKRGRT